MSGRQIEPARAALALEVAAAVAVVYGMPVRTVLGRATSTEIVRARHVAMTLARDLTELAFADLAVVFARSRSEPIARAHADIRSLLRLNVPLQRQVMAALSIVLEGDR